MSQPSEHMPGQASASPQVRPARRLVGVAASCFLIVALAGFASGCTSPEAEEALRPVVGEKLLMSSMIDPAADVLWSSVQTIMTIEGTEEVFPKSDEEWAAVRNAAVVLAESGNLLMIGRRARDQEDWARFSKELTDVGEKAMQIADAQDVQATFDVGGEVYLVCRNCHQAYWPDDPTM